MSQRNTAKQGKNEMTYADETLRQLGGMGRVKAMIGAKNFASDNDGRTLVFKFPGSRKANFVKITLNGLDLYDVEFVKIGNATRKNGYNPKITTTGTFEGLYNDMLISTFENFTGLYLKF